MAAFLLSKWYLDCVTQTGETAIAYTGTASWGAVRLHYSSLLKTNAGRVEVRHSLRKLAEPHLEGDRLSWSSRPLSFDGEWRASPAAQLRETIFESEDGQIEWHCLMPRAKVCLNIRCGNHQWGGPPARGRPLAGPFENALGYVEHLRSTIAPWRMPISTLRWGRFLTDSHSAVWIDWLGQYARRVVYVDGRPAKASAIEDDRIELDGGSRIVLDRSLTLRAGPLGTTALAAIPGLRKTFPARLLRIEEIKWRSRATMTFPDGSSCEGWAIHERVDWPKP